MKLEMELIAHPLANMELQDEIAYHNMDKFLNKHAKGAINGELGSLLRFESAIAEVDDCCIDNFECHFVDDATPYESAFEAKDIAEMSDLGSARRIKVINAAKQHLQDEPEVQSLSEEAKAYYETLFCGRDGYTPYAMEMDMGSFEQFDFYWEDADHIHRWFDRRLTNAPSRFQAYKHHKNDLKMLTFNQRNPYSGAYKAVRRDDLVELRRVLKMAIYAYEQSGGKKVARQIFLDDTLPLSNIGSHNYDDAYHQVNVRTLEHVDMLLDTFDFGGGYLYYYVQMLASPNDTMRVIGEKTDGSPSDAVKL